MAKRVYLENKENEGKSERKKRRKKVNTKYIYYNIRRVYRVCMQCLQRRGESTTKETKKKNILILQRERELIVNREACYCTRQDNHNISVAVCGLSSKLYMSRLGLCECISVRTPLYHLLSSDEEKQEEKQEVIAQRHNRVHPRYDIHRILPLKPDKVHTKERCTKNENSAAEIQPIKAHPGISQGRTGKSKQTLTIFLYHKGPRTMK